MTITGGIRTLYRHVEVLAKAGLNAHSVRDQVGFKLDWFASAAPVTHIDQDLFRPPARNSALSVCFMPRKGGSNLRTSLGILWHRAPALRSIRWHPIDQQPEAQVAEIMRQSTLFLSTMFREGFGLPPLEAMVCGSACRLGSALLAVAITQPMTTAFGWRTKTPSRLLPPWSRY